MLLAGNAPRGFFRFKSGPHAKDGCKEQYLGLQDQSQASGRLQLVAKDAAVIVKISDALKHTLSTNMPANALCMQVIPGPSPLYLSVPWSGTAVDLWHSSDGSGRQVWLAKNMQGDSTLLRWQLSVSKGHQENEGRLSLSCGWDNKEKHVDLWQWHTWILEETLDMS